VTEEEVDWAELVQRLARDLLRQRASAQPRGSARARRLAAERRDSEAWSLLLRRLTIYAKANALTRIKTGDQSLADTLEDTVQDVIKRFADWTTHALRRLRKSRVPALYAMAVVRNTATDAVRQRAKRREESLEAHTPEIAAPEARDLEGETAVSSDARVRAHAKMREILAGLEPSDRELLRLRFEKELTIAEIARITGTKYSTAAVSLHRLVRRLRQRFGEFKELRGGA